MNKPFKDLFPALLAAYFVSAFSGVMADQNKYKVVFNVFVDSSQELQEEAPLDLRLPPTEEQPRKKDFKLSSFKRPEVWTQTKRLLLVKGAALGILYLLPENSTNWNRKEFGRKYIENIKNGPTWDEDDPLINYVGHPYAGAIYYRMGIDAGLSPLESLLYSTFVSTIIWEYGIESLAESPSIQDLVITPTLGALLGELFIRWDEKIKNNNNSLLGSKILGKTALAFMNPVEAVFGPPTKDPSGQKTSVTTQWFHMGDSNSTPEDTVPIFAFEVKF